MTESVKQRFESLVLAHTADLYRFAYWLCRERALAEDLVQETYIRAWKSLDNLKDEKASKPWLFTILRNEHIRQFKRNQPLLVDINETDLDRVEFAQMNTIDTDNSRAIQLHQALKQLPEKYYEPLVLQVMGGFSCDEIANQLGLTSGAVMTRLSRARMQLREIVNTDENAGLKDKIAV